MKFKSVENVVESGLCAGCGACAGVCTRGAISIKDVVDTGYQPFVDRAKCTECGRCVRVCPGVEVSAADFNGQTIAELREGWGPVLKAWVGYARDPEIRFKGSSGGLVTALALYCIERESTGGVLHTGFNPEMPLRNVPVFSSSREQLIACAGSRYSPAAPCEGLKWVEDSDKSCVFIGKPCDIAALNKSQAVRPKLKNKINLTISIFCAGTPATRQTYQLLDILGVRPEDVELLRYRGFGWPGATTVRLKGGKGQLRQMTYEQAWGEILSRGQKLRCTLCPDSTGEMADISCGDAWHKRQNNDEAGWSVALVRTERGKRIFHRAMNEGYIIAAKIEGDVIIREQKAHFKRKSRIWGRMGVMRAFGLATPAFSGFSLEENWARLGGYEKFRTIGGTIKRIITRNFC